SLLISYVLAVFSLAFGFIVVAFAFNFDSDSAAAFGALAGSWMGGTANMIAVGSALGVSQEAFGYALIVDSVNYTLWVMLLLFLVPSASMFNKFTKSDENMAYLSEIGCACNMGAPRYWLLILLALVASIASQVIAQNIEILNKTTTIVLIASTLGVLGSFTRLKELNGSSEVASTMLYLLIALIGSKAVFDNFSDVGVYVLAGFSILVIHALIMIVGAKIFKLDLFSVAVASLSNIGGVASAPILAATYNKSLVSVGVLMAIMGYLIGTFGGLLVGNILIEVAK
ncbi:MAG: putative membrane protein, partial [Sulfurimonas sp.]